MAITHEVWKRFRPSSATAVLCGGVLIAAVGLASTQGGQDPDEDDQTKALPALGSAATADSNGRMIAVTGVDVTGSSVLYLVDTVKGRLAIYQASSTGSNQGVRLVGARRIELDMELDGFNDHSEYSYKQLKEEFGKKGLLPDSTQPAASRPAGN
jgi:hypothetical protein